MQNLPFLITQNAPSQKSVSTTNNQKVAESGVSFKQVLSKQIEQEPPQEHLVKQTKAQKNQLQAKLSTSETEVVKTSEQDFTNTKVDLDAGDLVLATPLQGNTETELEGKLSAEVSNEESATAVSQETNAALVASLQLPTNVTLVNTNVVPVQDNGASNLQINQRTDILKQDQKMLLQDDKSFNKDASNTDQQPSEVGTSDKKWSENLLPKINRPTEYSETINAKVSSKLTVESIAKSSQEPALPQTTASVSTPMAPVVTTLSSVQAQAGSSNSISAYPGKTGWDQAISQKVVWMVGAVEQSATLTLNPPDLGPLQVVINVNNDKADTTFISENPEVRKALENGIPVLRELMDQAGVQLGQTNVSTGKQQQEFQQMAKERSAQQAAVSASSQPAETQVVTHPQIRSSNGLVDTFA